MSFPLNEFYEHLRLVFREAFERGFVLVEDFFFHLFEVFFTFFLIRQSLDVFVSFFQSLAD